MPLSKKRVKSEKKKRRDRSAGPAAPSGVQAESSSGGGGLMGRMRGGIKDLAGSGPKKKESLASKILTWALVVAAAYFLARRFGIIR